MTDIAIRFLPASLTSASHSPDCSVEQQQLGAFLQAQDIAQIIGLRRVQLDPRASASGVSNEQAGRLLGGQAGVAGIAIP